MNGTRAARPRRLSAGQRRASILAAGLEAFGRAGYHGASVEHVAELSGVTKPVVYDHFASKQQLYIAVLDEQASALLAAIGRHTNPRTESLEERLSEMARAMCLFARRNPRSTRLLFRETVSDEQVTAAYAELRRRSVQIAADITASDPNFTPPPGMSRATAALALGELQYTAFAAIARFAYDHPGLPVTQLVTVFMDFTWIGLGRNTRGEHWRG